MMFVCPHCGADEFQLWAGIDGKAAVQCLNCGEASPLDQSKLSESRADGYADAARIET
jgi:Zn ribbon nucleic-acid-binding protein